jgi:hypothetical protein
MMRLHISWILSAAVALQSTQALAVCGKKKHLVTAEDWSDEGEACRGKFKNAEAIEAFRKAHHLHPTAATFAQMGFAEYELKQYLEAEAHLEEALADPKHPWVVLNGEYVREVLDKTRKQIGHLMIKGSEKTDGATVQIDQVVAETLPLKKPISLLADRSSQVVIKKEGFFDWEQHVSIPGDDKKVLDVELIPIRRDLPDIQPPAAAPSEPPEPRPASLPPAAPASAAGVPSATTSNVLPITLGLGGVAALVVGGVLLSKSGEKCETPSDEPGFPCEMSRPVSPWAGAGVLGGGVAALVVAAYLYKRDGKSAGEHAVVFRVSPKSVTIGGTW